MGLGQAAIGIGATLLSKFLALKTWTLVNRDNQSEVLRGQFPAENVTRGAGNNYQVTTALNRQNPIIQFINGELDTLTIASRFWRKDLFDELPTDRIDKLLDWVKVDPKLRRPPILTFALGDGLGLTMQVVLEKVDNIVYGVPNALGGIREVSFNLTMRAHVPFDINATEVTDTRYHRVKDGEFYEQIAQREYGNPLLGVHIRRLHPSKPIAQTGDIVKLPAIEGVRSVDVNPRSIALATAFGNKNTVQRQNRIAHFNRRSGSMRSFLFSSAIQQPSIVQAGGPSTPNDLWIPGDPDTRAVRAWYANPYALPGKGAISLVVPYVDSDDIENDWDKTNATVTGGHADPDGGNGAFLITESTDGAPTEHYITESINNAISNPAQIIYEFWVKDAGSGRDWIVISGDVPAVVYEQFFQADGTEGYSQQFSLEVLETSGAWKKMRLTQTAMGQSAYFDLRPANAGTNGSDSYQGDGRACFYLYDFRVYQTHADEWGDESLLTSGSKREANLIQTTPANRPLCDIKYKEINNFPILLSEGGRSAWMVADHADLVGAASGDDPAFSVMFVGILDKTSYSFPFRWTNGSGHEDVCLYRSGSNLQSFRTGDTAIYGSYGPMLDTPQLVTIIGRSDRTRTLYIGGEYVAQIQHVDLGSLTFDEFNLCKSGTNMVAKIGEMAIFGDLTSLGTPNEINEKIMADGGGDYMRWRWNV